MTAILENPLFWPILTTLVIIALLPLVIAFTVLLERKVLADMQTRLGPMRVGPNGLLQTIADALKLLLKEDIIPSDANIFLFRVAPVISFFTAATSLSVIPISNLIQVADVNVGILIISAMSAVGIIGIILGGWSSNSHYSLLGGLRSAAQLVSYEVALALALVSGIMAAGSLSMREIVEVQLQRGIWLVFDNYGFMIVPFMVYFISSIAETNRAPFDLPEAESELVAGFHTEYSGMRWGLYMLAEYGAMFVVGSVAVTLFWGGWLRPFPGISWLEIPFNYIFPALVVAGSGLGCFYLIRRQPIKGYALGITAVGVLLLLVGALFLVPVVNARIAAPFWFFLKLGSIIYAMIWFRGTFPRYRYDQLMNIGWKAMIPTGLAAIFINALIGVTKK